ncbi:hypothetical protein N7486_001439 [Penicillium sp. IBT 16267x]|nr:hypothetical protein N7486_001439 [Penicillium sp. IBT 16267x]
MPAPVTRHAKRPASDPTPGPPVTKKAKHNASKTASKITEKPKAPSKGKGKEKAKEAKNDEKGKPKPNTASQSKNAKITTKKTVDAPKGWTVNDPDLHEFDLDAQMPDVKRTLDNILPEFFQMCLERYINLTKRKTISKHPRLPN